MHLKQGNHRIKTIEILNKTVRLGTQNIKLVLKFCDSNNHKNEINNEIAVKSTESGRVGD